MNKYFLTDAYESDVRYWAEFKNVKKDADGLITSFTIRDNDAEGARISEEWHTITFSDILKAANKIKNGEIKIREDIAAQFIGKPENWDYDSYGTDCALQVAIFDNIIYG